jgi:hypothetical protein
MERAFPMAAVLAALLAGAWAPVLYGQGPDYVPETERQANLNRCLSGGGFGCDASLLRRDEAMRVESVQRERELNRCLNGTGCDPSRLGAAERDRLGEEARRENYRTCLVSPGAPGCDTSLLRSEESLRIREIQALRQAAPRPGVCLAGHDPGCPPALAVRPSSLSRGLPPALRDLLGARPKPMAEEAPADAGKPSHSGAAAQ